MTKVKLYTYFHAEYFCILTILKDCFFFNMNATSLTYLYKHISTHPILLSLASPIFFLSPSVKAPNGCYYKPFGLPDLFTRAT